MLIFRGKLNRVVVLLPVLDFQPQLTIRKINKNSCISYSPHYHNQTPAGNNLMKNGLFYKSLKFQGTDHHGGALQAECKADGHLVSIIHKQREMNFGTSLVFWFVLSFFFSV